MDADGFPLAFDLHPGKQNEQKTLKPLEQKVIRDFDCSEFIYCSDSGLGSQNNKLFNDMGGRSYVVTQSLKKLKKEERITALDPKQYRKLGSEKFIDLRELDENDPEVYKSIYYKEIYAYVYRQTGNEELAKDLTQDIFIQILQKIAMFDHKKASFRTWMYRIASNKICDHYRSKVHRLSLKQEQIDMTDENLELHSGNLGTAIRDLSELIIHKELIEDIMEIVSLYKQEWQEIFYMKCFEERTFQDISQTLNISENTVKSRFYKMIRQIKSEVDYQ